MSVERRSRSTLSSSSTAFSNKFLSSALNPCLRNDDSSRSYAESWVKKYNQKPRSNAQFCLEISSREALIDRNQVFAQNCRKAIRDLQIYGGNDALIASRNNKLLTFERK
ncbi:hypothetical protein AVEN_21003-1 [Araneus ventricosus]|uniref:Uncharacterized protein n=1 Tax=Araneus ventricosus TaxID=182803 RepID=A0A4Y2D8B7_ARAVE|nr:hypothetical protein AVEN_21003-1 [Araneus ventricosus]